MINLHVYEDLSLFKEDVIPFLEQHEVENSLILGILGKAEDAPTFMATVYKEDQLALVLLQTHPRQVILSKSIPLKNTDIPMVADEFYRVYHEIPGLIGETKLTTQLADYLSAFKNTDYEIHMNQRIYELKHVEKEADSNGLLRLVTEEEQSVAQEWLFHFCEEVNEAISREEATEKALSFIKNNRMYGWEVDGKLVATASRSRQTKNSITVSFVYTPKEERKKGYASNVVAALTEELLNQGYKTTALYTDLDNPTSNKIYMEIGYKPVMDSIVIYFH